MNSAPASSTRQCPRCGARFDGDALFCPDDGSPLTSGSSSGPSSDPYVGHELVGQIEIAQLIGIGAMGRVYRAFQKGIDRDVAVKILHRELSSNPQLVTRFHREAKVASKLQHPNVVHVHLTGQLTDGSIYIAMEYLDGLSLQSALAAAGGAMPLPRALHIALQLSEAVGEAHSLGIVHRDIKPENVMLVRRGGDDDFVKVLDFGIARLNWGDQSMATAAGLIFGTARYISPEGAQGEPVGPAGDVYSIATLVYQMLSGRTPFDGEQAVSLLIQQIHDHPSELRSIARASYVPEPIAAMIMRNLSKSPADRDEDGRAFGRALAAAASASGIAAEHLAPRLLSTRPSAIQLSPIQRTKKLELDQELAERIGAPMALESSVPPPRPTGTEWGDPLPPAARTTRWTPPADVQVRLRGSVTPTPLPTPTPLEATMDDEAQPAAPAADLSRLASKLASNAGANAGPRPSSPVTPLPSPVERPAYFTPPPRAGETPLPRATQSTPSDSRALGTSRVRAIALVIACFLVGVLGAGGIAYKMGMFAPQATATDHVNRATQALMAHHYDDPPGECVRDLTRDGLSRWPNEPRLMRLRSLAADDVVNLARTKHRDGNRSEALRLVQLAREFDAANADANALAAQLDSDGEPTSVVPPLNPTTVSSALASANGAKVSPTAAVRAVLDVSTAQAKIGAPVDLTGRIVGAQPATKIEDARMVVVGPGLGSGVQVPSVEYAGAYRAAFTFLQAGKFEVIFSARIGASPIRASRSIVTAAVGQTHSAEAPPSPPAPPPPPSPPANSSSTSPEKWL